MRTIGGTLIGGPGGKGGNSAIHVMLQSGSVQHKTTEALVRPARAAGLHAHIKITAKSKENICHFLSERERGRMGRGAGGGMCVCGGGGGRQ